MWFFYSATAAVIWGMFYVLLESVVRRLSPASYIGITSLGTALLMLTYALLRGDLARDLSILADSRRLLALVAAIIVLAAAGNFLIVSAVAAKNASYVSAVEIAYPLFVAFFSWVIFRQPLSLSMLFGAVLIFAGAVMISLSH